jgi:hypothetical protein
MHTPFLSLSLILREKWNKRKKIYQAALRKARTLEVHHLSLFLPGEISQIEHLFQIMPSHAICWNPLTVSIALYCLQAPKLCQFSVVQVRSEVRLKPVPQKVLRKAGALDAHSSLSYQKRSLRSSTFSQSDKALLVVKSCQPLSLILGYPQVSNLNQYWE